MPDQKHRTRYAILPTSPELGDQPPDIEDVPLRETWAYKVRPADRAAVEHLCASVLELARDVAGGPHPSYPEAFAAAASDLRSIETYLRVVGASEGDDLDREQRRLADVAVQLAPAVGEVARQLEAAVAGRSEP